MTSYYADNDYKIKLNVFEGPMDLLLHLIKKSKLDIRDIPIALITEQYLDYINMMQDLNLDVAGDFLVMASYLMYLKSRTLLCLGSDDDEDPEEAKKKLAQRLIEYQVCKKKAEFLTDLEAEHSKLIPSRGISVPCKEEMIEADLYDLLNAYYIIVKEKVNPAQPHSVSIDPITIHNEMTEIISVLKVKKKVFFRLLYKNIEPGHFIIGFLAILELARTNKVKILQDRHFGDIVVILA
ncbi:MAG: segregation and condensation protein A [bacterium]